MTHLLDTNVLSELVSAHKNETVVARIEALDAPYISWVSIQEMAFGIERMPQGRRRSELWVFLQRIIERFQDHLITISAEEVWAAARFQAAREKIGDPVELGDALIAGTAEAHGLTIVTRNVKDFSGVGLTVLDPWEDSA